MCFKLRKFTLLRAVRKLATALLSVQSREHDTRLHRPNLATLDTKQSLSSMDGDTVYTTQSRPSRASQLPHSLLMNVLSLEM